MWSLFTSGALALIGLSDGAPPPNSPIACTPAEALVATTLRRARLDPKLDAALLGGEIAAMGPAVLRPCLDTLELERVAQVVPGDRLQSLSVPQRAVVLAALAELPPAPLLGAAFERVALSRAAAQRRMVLDVLGVAGGLEHLPTLAELALLEGESDPPRAVEESFRSALARLLTRHPRAYDRLAVYHRDVPESLGDAVVCAVGDAGDPRGLLFLEHVITFRPTATGLCASQVRRLGRSGDVEVDRALAQRLRWAVDPDQANSCGALLLALGELRDYEAVPVLIEILDGEDQGLAGNALWALHRITELEFPALPERWRAWYASELAWFEREEELALRDLHVGPPSAAAAAARAISERRLWREDLALELLTALERPHPTLRAPICRALERLGVTSIAPGLVDLLEDEDSDGAKAALRALVTLTGRDDLPADATTWRLALAMDS